MSPPAEWAMKAAREIVAMRFSVTPKVAAIVASGGMDSEEPDIANIASAIEAADKAATERAAALAGRKASDYFNGAEKAKKQGRRSVVDAFMHLSGEYAALAAAIRNGGDNG